MSRFQAQTNSVLELELNQIQAKLGLRHNQKADLLRELAAITSWVIRQSTDGRIVQAKGTDGVKVLRQPSIERIRQSAHQPHEINLTKEEAQRLSEIMSGEFTPPPVLKEMLRRLASDDRKPPPIVWQDR